MSFTILRSPPSIRIKVEEFVDIVKKLVAFSRRCLEIKEQLKEVYEGSTPLKTV
jgi:hypothetical protein